MNSSPGLLFIFKSFFKVGATSFGGYASLVAIVQRILVEQYSIIKNEDIIKGFSIASVLPGPVAVNTVTYIGYSLAKWPGALVAMVAVILPAMIMMILLAILFERFGNIVQINQFLAGVIPVIMAIILSATYNIGSKSLKHFMHYIILLLVLILQFYFDGYWTFLLSFFIGGSLGLIFFKKERISVTEPPKSSFRLTHIIVIVILLSTVILNFISIPINNINLSLASVFSGISLSLFGGGYVMIPMLNDIIVFQKAWLSHEEFMNAIAFGQITPGPILISATYIGYKLNGITGAIIATFSIFLPSGLLMIIVSESLKKLDQNSTWQAILDGLKPVVVALMLASIFVLGDSIENWWFSALIFAVSALLIIRYKVNFIWLFVAAGILGIFFI